ncbi:RNA-binding protein 44 [Electrophorus electricus]|uniref:RNA-binding protein 44 n=1 Tax=Electrophorus electricus TaxID=8005 RepID=UPI0015D092B5|nr:RNA-binding protein 44 [Electrophorus electricus]
MWYPPPALVPFYFEPNSRSSSNVYTTMMWQMIQFDQQVCLAMNEVVGDLGHSLSVDDGRQFLLNKSVFDLVGVSHFLELSDPKLLSWYLSLPVEDRQLIEEQGGFLHFLQRHPALEVSSHIVRLKQQIVGNCLPLPGTDMSSKLNMSRQPMFYGVLHCLNCGTSCPSGAKKCRQCNKLILNPEESVGILEEEKTLRLLPNNVREELNLLKARKQEVFSVRNPEQLGFDQSTSNESPSQITSANGSQHAFDGSYAAQACPDQQELHTTKAQLLSRMWEGGVWCGGTEVAVFQDPSAQASFSLDVELDMQSHNQISGQGQRPMPAGTRADLTRLEQETLPEYYSFNSTVLAHGSAQWNDVTESHEPCCSDSMMATMGSAEVSTVEHVERFPDSVSCVSNLSEWTGFTEDYQDLSNEDELRGQHKLLVESTTQREGCDVSPVACLMSQAVDVSSDFRDNFTSNQATEMSQSFFARPCRDVASGSDSFTINHEQETQTVQVSAYEKCTITEVYMSNLDAVSEKLKLLKDTEAGGERQKRACACDAVQRAQRAELRLLALQFAMCLQHCWRRYYTSPQGEAALHGTEALPDVMAQTLKCLEEDYFEAKRKILAGVPLENLKPLSVDSQKIATGTCYSPAWISEAYLGDILLEASSRSPSGLEHEGEFGQAEGMSTGGAEGGLQHTNRTTPPQDDAGPQLDYQDGGGISKEMNSSEAWFDAEEELVSSGQICKEEQEARWRDKGKLKMKQKGVEDANEKKSHTSLVYVTGLSSNVTECDLLLWFERYHANQVCITSFSNNSVAIVSVRSPTDAEAAVREVSGRSVQGHTLHVEHVQQSPASGGRPIKESCRDHPPAAHKTRSTGQRPSTRGSQSSIRLSGPLHCSLDKLTNIHDTPTALGTCVPQHYATMGSFDTIISRLSERHPEVGRQRIVGALLALRAKHQHVLSGLPLRQIVDMTSELLMAESTTNVDLPGD